MDEQLAGEFHQLHEQQIHRMHAAIEVEVYSAETVITVKRTQLQAHRDGAVQAATTRLDGDR